MQKLIFVFFLNLVCISALADFEITVQSERADRTIKSSLNYSKKSCTGKNGEVERKHKVSKCANIEKKYKNLIASEPETLPAADDEPTYEIQFKNSRLNWERVIGQVSSGSQSNSQLKELSVDILTINAK